MLRRKTALSLSRYTLSTRRSSLARGLGFVIMHDGVFKHRA